jgi:L-lactate dehydrogenase complex protein LldG
MERLTFLARLRVRLDGAEFAAGLPASVPSEAHHAESTAGEGLVELFTARLRVSGGVVARAGSRGEAWAALERLAVECGWRTLACPPGVRPAGAGGSDDADGDCLRFTSDPRAADFGFSEADWAVAETGSVVVKASAEVRRGYSLVPPAVGFFVPRSRLRASIGDVLRELPTDGGSLPSCVSFISGPSGTSDLAAVHVVGVHGPGEVFVWVVEDGEPAG